MLTQSRLRLLLRWSYTGVAGFLGAYAYLQLHAAHPGWTDAARCGVLPVVRLAGTWVWQQGYITRWVRDLRTGAAHA